MKFSCPSIVLFFLATSISASDVAEVPKEAGSLFDRSLPLTNALCLPLFDGCNFRSKVASCGDLGDACRGGLSCVKTTAGGVVCATEGSGGPCDSSRDCPRGEVCGVGDGCPANFCVQQVRRG